jgi:hypothetical protein
MLFHVDILRMHSSLHHRRFLTSTVLGLPLLQARDTPAKIDIHVDPSRVLGPVLNDFLGFGYEISSVAVQGLLSPATGHCSSTTEISGPKEPSALLETRPIFLSGLPMASPFLHQKQLLPTEPSSRIWAISSMPPAGGPIRNGRNSWEKREQSGHRPRNPSLSASSFWYRLIRSF